MIKKVFVIIVLFLFLPISVKANIICNDGTESPSCSDCHQGCCSWHGGCRNNSYSNDDYEDEEEDYDEEEEDNGSDSLLWGTLGLGTIGGIIYGASKGKKE